MDGALSTLLRETASVELSGKPLILANRYWLGSAYDVSMSMARFDLEAAVGWLKENGPGGKSGFTSRRSKILSAWAAENPEQAMELIGNSDYHQASLGRGIIQGDPSLAADLMERIDDHGTRARSLVTTFHDLNSNYVQDYFPFPGGRNRLPPSRYRRSRFRTLGGIQSRSRCGRCPCPPEKPLGLLSHQLLSDR